MILIHQVCLSECLGLLIQHIVCIDKGSPHVLHFRIDMFLIFLMVLMRIDLYIVNHLITMTESILKQFQPALQFSPCLFTSIQLRIAMLL